MSWAGAFVAAGATDAAADVVTSAVSVDAGDSGDELEQERAPTTAAATNRDRHATKAESAGSPTIASDLPLNGPVEPWPTSVGDR